MARPRIKTLPLSDLKCFDTIVLELKSMPEFEDFDIGNAIVSIKQRKPVYTAKPESIETAIKNLEKYIEKNGTDKFAELTKQDMSALLGISRPTLDRWIEAEIIERGTIGFYHGIEIRTFTAISVLNSLEELRQK
ncbi:hypothetical protein KCV26_15635 [Petrimonas sulfuriphila]|uniref:helix-turn-helix domain-containing protein n=1 Tax=Petrimonas sulfuriphila TaxID=285070 RepID=UPI0032437BC1